MIANETAPTRVGSAIALCWVFVSIGVSALYSLPALAVGGIGGLLFASGLLGDSRRRLSGGVFFVFVAALIAATLGAPVDATLLGVVTAVLAWDAGGVAMSLGTQLGNDAPTIRAELVHLSASAGIGLFTIVFGYAIFSLWSGAVSISALIYLLLAALVLLFAARVGSKT